jgi:SAM-dependent methyltransferase
MGQHQWKQKPKWQRRMEEEARALEAQAQSPAIKLDLGCGSNKREGFLGVDRRKFDGVDAVADLSRPGKWRFSEQHIGGLELPLDGGNGFIIPDSSIAEAHCSHFLEHLTGPQRVQFMNELYRVLRPGGTAMIITPYWCSSRAYGDFTHQWPPVGEMFFFYLNRDWRMKNAPDNDAQWNPDGYTCDFDWSYGYGMSAEIMTRSAQSQQFALANYKEAAQDLHATLTAARK